MEAKPRLTRQGIPDLNHYGPRRSAAESESLKPVDDAAIAATPLAVPDVVGEQPSDQETGPPSDEQ
jgi:hypothetical protein